MNQWRVYCRGERIAIARWAEIGTIIAAAIAVMTVLRSAAPGPEVYGKSSHPQTRRVAGVYHAPSGTES